MAAPGEPATDRPASGRQLRIAGGGYTATIATIGAAVRELRFGGRDVFVPFAEDEAAPRFHGVVLAPWPNRITDGEYALHGVAHRLSITEPGRGHALHGLVTGADFDVRRSDAASVALTTRIARHPGYPFDVETDVEYRLDADGLTTTVTATNGSALPAPFGTGAHPWIAAGADLGDAVLRIPAEAVLEVAGERMLPGVVADVPRALDFRRARPVGGTRIDHAFTGLIRDPDGLARVDVRGPDGWGARLTVGPRIPWVQVCTSAGAGETEPASIAIEPMTCPPDAFASGTDLVLLAPGEPRSWSWRYSALEGDPR